MPAGASRALISRKTGLISLEDFKWTVVRVNKVLISPEPKRKREGERDGLMPCPNFVSISTCGRTAILYLICIPSWVSLMIILMRVCFACGLASRNMPPKLTHFAEFNRCSDLWCHSDFSLQASLSFDFGPRTGNGSCPKLDSCSKINSRL